MAVTPVRSQTHQSFSNQHSPLIDSKLSCEIYGCIEAVVVGIGNPPKTWGNIAIPSFRTKDILFSLPTLRHSNSLGDLGVDEDSDPDTEYLLPTAVPTQRSNSFSCYGLGIIDPAMYRSASMELEDASSYPEGHLGRIWFSVRYEPSTEKLLVSLLKAKNLPSRTVGTVNSCDPFVRLHLLPDERRYLQSKMKKKTCNPFFDETFIFQVRTRWWFTFLQGCFLGP